MIFYQFEEPYKCCDSSLQNVFMLLNSRECKPAVIQSNLDRREFDLQKDQFAAGSARKCGTLSGMCLSYAWEIDIRLINSPEAWYKVYSELMCIGALMGDSYLYYASCATQELRVHVSMRLTSAPSLLLITLLLFSDYELLAIEALHLNWQ